jgi:predicted RNA-binding protein (virulence factor B family)
MQIGEFHELEVIKELPFGVYLDSERGEILLPTKYIPEGLQIGDYINVFLYKDSEDRLIATTLTPYGKLNDFVPLEVTDVVGHGAYLDWGLEKDLLVPMNEQPQPYQVGDIHVVRICLDFKTDRLIGVGKIHSFFDPDISQLTEDQDVEMLIYSETEMGYSAIIDQRYTGLLYKNEIFQPLRIGDRMRGFVKKLRDDDKIDLRLGKIGLEAIDVNAQKVLKSLASNDGFLALHDKSEPEEILRLVKMSKKAFKKAIGGLYKQKQIEILEDGIKLIK